VIVFFFEERYQLIIALINWQIYPKGGTVYVKFYFSRMAIIPDTHTQNIDFVKITVLKTEKGEPVRKTVKRFDNGIKTVQDFNRNNKYWYREPHTIPRDIDAFKSFLETTESRADCCLVTGEPCGEVPLGQKVQRLKNAQGDTPATLAECAAAWLPIDIDKAVIPTPLDPLDQLASIMPLVDAMGAPFNNTHFVWQLTASATPGGGKLSVRLFYLVDQPITNDQRKQWAELINKRLGVKLVDICLYQAVQPIYTAAPHFQDGIDPFPQRIGVCYGELDAIPWGEVPTIPTKPEGGRVSGHTGPWPRSRTIDEHLSNIGDHKGGEGLHKPLTLAIFAMVRERWIDDRIKEIVRRAVWSAFWDKSKHDDDYLKSQVSDYALNASIRGAENRLNAAESNPQRITQTRKFDRLESLEEGQRRIAEHVEKWARGEGPRVQVLAVTTGAGKTHTTVNVLQALLKANPSKKIAWSFPTHKQAAEVLESFGEMAVKIDTRVPNREGVQPLCQRPELIEAIQQAGLSSSTAKIACERDGNRCPFFSSCEYYQQFRGGHQVRLIPHETLKLNRSRALEVNFRRDCIGLVIDESPINSLIESKSYKVNEIMGTAGPVLAFLVNARKQHNTIQEANITGPELADLLEKLTAEELEFCGAEDFVSGPGEADKDLLIEELKARAATRGPSLWPLYKAARQWCEGNKNGFWLSKDKADIWAARMHAPPEFERGLILDATPNEPAYRAIYGQDIEFIYIDVAQNLEIIQADDVPVGRRALVTPDNDTLPQAIALARGLPGKTGFISHQAAVDMAAAQGWIVGESAHFNALRGLNSLAECDNLVIAGRTEPPALAVEAMARALYPDEDLNLPGAYNWTDDNGFMVASHPDPRVDELLRACRESEIIQAIGRLRAVRSPETKRVYLLTHTPTPYTVTRARFDQMVLPGELARYMLKTEGLGVLIPEVMAEIMPELWKDARAAKNWRDRNLKDSLSLLSNLIKQCEPFKFRRQGQKRHSGLLSWHTEETTRAELERLLNAVIVELTPPPAPPADVVMTLWQIPPGEPMEPPTHRPPDIVLRGKTLVRKDHTEEPPPGRVNKSYDNKGADELFTPDRRAFGSAFGGAFG
jgi:hypothetical protein